MHFLVCKGLSIHDVGVSRDTVFQKIRPGAGFETGDFVKEKFGGLPWNDSYLLCFIYLHGVRQGEGGGGGMGGGAEPKKCMNNAFVLFYFLLGGLVFCSGVFFGLFLVLLLLFLLFSLIVIFFVFVFVFVCSSRVFSCSFLAGSFFRYLVFSLFQPFIFYLPCFLFSLIFFPC